jgi:HD-like signal output (HDOD) protein
MFTWLLSLLLIAAGAALGATAIRPVRRKPVAATAAVTVQSGDAAGAHQVDISLELPADLKHLPEPPVLSAAPVQILDTAEISRRLRELELGVVELGQRAPDHDHIVAAAVAAICDPATQKRYAPRRPNLLPQLMRAVNDEDVSRRELAALIARDPSLVGGLLKMANSSYYRTLQPVETIERAVVVLGSDGMRSLMAAALMQPIFQVSNGGPFSRFPEVVWDHALRSAQAAIPHAAVVERADAFAAELLSLITGLAEIVLFRAALDTWVGKSGQKSQPDPLVMASLLDSQTAAVAWRIGADWELSELMLAALEEQMNPAEPTTPLGRSLRFGRVAGALAVLHTNSVIDDAQVRMSLPEAGLSPAHLRSMWTRLLRKHEDPRVTSKSAPRAANDPRGGNDPPAVSGAREENKSLPYEAREPEPRRAQMRAAM